MHQVIIPKSEILKKYISSFNILKKYESTDNANYYAFPQIGTTIGFFKHSDIKVQNNILVIDKNLSENPKAVLLGKYLNPIKVCYINHVEKISIHFTETGVNYFFSDYFQKTSKETIQVINLNALNIDSDQLFNEDIHEGLVYLENYLLNKIEFVDLEQIEKAIDLLWKNPSMQTKELASRVALTEKTLNRRFQKYVGCRTSEFKRIVRFKKTLADHFDSNPGNLTELCHNNDYYDAPHFYKQIIETTSFTPKVFFKNIKKMGLEDHVYIPH